MSNFSLTGGRLPADNIMMIRSDGGMAMSTASRLALAGGSDERPPTGEPRSAEIIEFPRERRRRRDDEAGATSNGPIENKPVEPT
jgi:hypothetical protein